MVDPLKVFWVLTNSTYLVTKFIRIGIADKNDSPPYFEKTLYEAEVDENEELNHTVLTVTAKDYDDYARIRYEITSGNIGGAFSVRNTTGDIYVAGRLDYEKRKRYELRLAAIDNSKENYTTVVIHVRDVNDNPPVFERSTYRTQITEEDDRNLPKSVLKVTANDGDVDRPHNIIYFITGQGIDPDSQSNSKFDINRTSGEIYVLKPLDRDQPHGHPQWRFNVFAQDEGGEGLVGYADVQINLKDINDNAPVFLDGIYYGNVTENGTAGVVVMTMSAVDYDDPNESTNARLLYSIEKNVIEEDTGSPIFEIEPETGTIRTTVCCLDREKTPDYSIQVVAMDGGGLKGTGTASIRVKDINDMPPQFTKDEWFTEIDETVGNNLPEMPILTVTVHDEDETNNFHYKVIESSGYGAEKFTMIRNNDGTGSLKIIEPLDYEDLMQSNGFRFRILVNDKGDDYDQNDNYHVAYSWVVVKLRDINDNQPKFKRPNIEVSIYENAEVGTSLETFKALDPDQGGLSKVTYAIDRTTDRQRQFAINQEGTVTIQRNLDREETPKHIISILAIDDGVPAKTATATLTVIVQDVNDNAPKLLENYKPIVQEHVLPKEIVELMATDKDDRSKNNGGPFHFSMDPSTSDMVKASFRVENKPKGGKNGEGSAIVTSLRSFDREEQSEYLIPIVIRDNGSPALSATNTLTVIIGDINDNLMEPGSKEILVYNYQGMSQESEIGRVYVTDLDDWDLPDKNFYWDGLEHPRFRLSENTGMLTMKQGTRDGVYHLKFKVYDRKHSQAEVPANVTVIVRDISHDAVLNSGSVRLAGITAEEFVRVWNSKTQTLAKSYCHKFRDKIADLLKVRSRFVDVFSVQIRRRHAPLTDVRFTVQQSDAGSTQNRPVKLNGIVLLHREEIERDVGVNITIVGINECLYESEKVCRGSCTNLMDISSVPYMVNANRTSLVGVRVTVSPSCTCGARNFSKPESCRNLVCYNGGRCRESRQGPNCVCPAGYEGPRCQQTSRSFRGNGWAWYPPLQLCDKSHLQFEFITKKPDGLLLYNGPIVPPEQDEAPLSDYIAVELDKGFLRLLLDFGSGTVELRIKSKKSLDDGEWHRVDVFWDMENVRMVLDFCQSADIVEQNDGIPPLFDDTSCQVQANIPPFNEFLNVNAPLQLGGLYVKQFDPTHYHWQYMPIGKSFEGCIKNLLHNSQLYDLANPGLHQQTTPGCPPMESVCQKLIENLASCSDHGTCVGNLQEVKCQCNPGWTGALCNVPTTPTSFKAQSYVKYALSFEPDKFTTRIQLKFRTREQHGELFRVSDQHNREYGILEMKNGHLRFRYNLNALRAEERDVWLSAVSVNDGQWHVVFVDRFGSTAILRLDGGEGRRYNESFVFSGYQWLMIDKQEGVYAGGKAEYTGVRTFEVFADYQKSCMDDIRLDGKQLPLPPAMNGTQWGQATMARNLEKHCHSNKPCSKVTCSEPFECLDLWNAYECTCGEGRIISPDNKDCHDKDECLSMPCQNGGTCINLEPRLRYRCHCPDDYWGENCELVQEGQTLKLSIGALAAILLCLLIILILVIVFMIYNRRKVVKKCPNPDDDVRENVISYNDEGGGEDDMTAFDITPLQIPIGGPLPDLPPNLLNCTISMLGGTIDRKFGTIIDEYRTRANNDPNAPPFDDLRNYAYEGGDSITGSLSSLASTEES